MRIMNRKIASILRGTVPALVLGSLALTPIHADEDDNAILQSKNSAGILATVTASGQIDTSNPFFKSFGTNGLACVHCHQPANGWSNAPDNLRARFDASHGTDLVFRPVDGANAPNADVSS